MVTNVSFKLSLTYLVTFVLVTYEYRAIFDFRIDHTVMDRGVVKFFYKEVLDFIAAVKGRTRCHAARINFKFKESFH